PILPQRRREKTRRRVARPSDGFREGVRRNWRAPENATRRSAAWRPPGRSVRPLRSRWRQPERGRGREREETYARLNRLQALLLRHDNAVIASWRRASVYAQTKNWG